jgi:hypothetical protein
MSRSTVLRFGLRRHADHGNGVSDVSHLDVADQGKAAGTQDRYAGLTDGNSRCPSIVSVRSSFGRNDPPLLKRCICDGWSLDEPRLGVLDNLRHLGGSFPRSPPRCDTFVSSHSSLAGRG